MCWALAIVTSTTEKKKVDPTDITTRKAYLPPKSDMC